MASPAFYIQYEDVKTRTFSEFKSLLQSTRKAVVGEMTIRELGSTPSANGLYFMFYSEGELAYIGKASSRSFVERVPAHFDQREEAWMNTVTKKILHKNAVGEYSEALNHALELELVLMGFEDRTASIKIEAALRSFLKPKLNPGRKTVQGEQRLSEFEA